MDGIEFTARQEAWQFFVTLTFRDPVPSEANRLKMLFAWLRTVARGAGKYRDERGNPSSVFFPSLVWLARSERGEATGRLHFHLLLTGLPAKRVNRTECFFQQDAWEKLGGGIARIRVYDLGLDGVSYVLKGLSEALEGANDYELTKFRDSGSRLLIASNAALEKWRGYSSRGVGHRAHRTAKSSGCDTTARRGSPRQLPSLTTSFAASKRLAKRPL